jgi:WD40 repeat protein
MKPLFIPRSGEYLFHSTRENTVDVWHLERGKLLSTCPGILAGVSKSGDFVITTTPAGPKAWEALTGVERDPHSLDPADFSFHQCFLPTVNRFKLVVELNDVLGIQPSQIVHIEHDPRYFPSLDTWAVAPDDHSLIATLSGEAAGQEWASGLCVDLSTGERRFKFKVNKFQSIPPINFSSEHNLLMISDDIYHLAVFDLATGHLLRAVWVNGFGNVASASIASPDLVAVNVWEPVTASLVSPFSVQILNLARLSSGGRMQRAAVEAVLPEPEAVVDLVFAPDNLHLASLLNGGSIRWWNLSTGKVDRIFKAREAA